MAIASRCEVCGQMLGVKAHVCPPRPPLTERLLRQREADRARRKRQNERRKAERAAAALKAQFDRDLRGDHDSPMSYIVLGPPDSTPTVAEILSREA